MAMQPFGTRVLFRTFIVAAALVVDGVLQNLAIDPADDAPLPGAIYRGTVDRLVKGQGGVFVRLPEGRSGFLRQVSGLAPGQPVLVQVTGAAEPGSLVLLREGRRMQVTVDDGGEVTVDGRAR